MVGVELLGEQLDLLVAQRLRGGDHLAELHEEADDVGRRAVQLGAELLRRRAALDDHLTLGHRGVRRGVGGEVHRLELLAAPAPATTLATGRALLRAAAATGATATGTTAGTATGPPGPPGPPPGRLP